MKYVILALVAIGFFIWYALANAAPFLVADLPAASVGVTAVKGSVDGTAFTTPYTVQSGKLLIYDIGSLSPAAHTFTNLRAVNVRGEGVGIPFALPALPPDLVGVTLVP